jgi:hypothetical protein
MFRWKIGGTHLKDLFIIAESFDNALTEARKINNNYCSGQVVEVL